MDILTVTTLYPNQQQPRHGIFVKNRLAAMDNIKDFNRKVIAPVAQNSLVSKFSDRFKIYDKIPPYEDQDSIDVYHPKYLTLPGIKIFDNATSMAKAAINIIDDIYLKNSSFDIVDGQYLYPDGVAAYQIAKNYNKPLVLTARGSDVNFWMSKPKVRQQILKSIDYASKVICVSAALKQSLMSYGVDEAKLSVIINGIDPEYFNPQIKANPLREIYFLSVGNLIALKGHNIILDAISELRSARLIIIGDGPEKKSLKSQVNEFGIRDRVQFISHLDQKKLGEFYAGATATILMSSMEGMPNVLLESLATGTPVIATNVGGVSEVVLATNGITLERRNAYDLVEAIKKITKLNQTRQQISDTVKDYRWSNVAKAQHDLYRDLL